MLFMRTILSLSLATFALAIPVAQPQAVGDHGGVGLIGRDDVFQELQNVVNEALGDSVASGFLQKNAVNDLINQIDGLVESGLIDGGSLGLNPDSVNGFLLRINNAVDDALSSIVGGGFLGQGVVDNLTGEIDNLVSPVLASPNSGVFVRPSPPRH